MNYLEIGILVGAFSLLAISQLWFSTVLYHKGQENFKKRLDMYREETEKHQWKHSTTLKTVLEKRLKEYCEHFTPRCPQKTASQIPTKASPKAVKTIHGPVSIDTSPHPAPSNDT